MNSKADASGDKKPICGATVKWTRERDVEMEANTDVAVAMVTGYHEYQVIEFQQMRP